MADSDRIRARRRRLHLAGDHSECKPGRCQALLGPPPRPAAAPPAQEGNTDGIAAATAAFVKSLPFAADPQDPRALLGQIAVRLAQRLDDVGPVPAIVRELRVMLAQLIEVPDQPPGPLDVFRLRRAQRRLDSWLEDLTSGGDTDVDG